MKMFQRNQEGKQNGKPAASASQIQPKTAESGNLSSGNLSSGDLSPRPLMVARALTKIYQTGAGGFTALKDINLQIYPGETLAVVGKSGSG